MTGCPVQLFLVDYDSLKKSFFNQTVKCADDNEIVGLGIQVFVDLLGAAWSVGMDCFQEIELVVGNSDILVKSRHSQFDWISNMFQRRSTLCKERTKQCRVACH